MYSKTRNRIIQLGGEGKSRNFWTTKGVRQGCPSRTTLFNNYINQTFPSRGGFFQLKFFHGAIYYVKVPNSNRKKEIKINNKSIFSFSLCFLSS